MTLVVCDSSFLILISKLEMIDLLVKAFENAGTFEDTKAVADALEKVVLEDTYVGKVTWEGQKSFGIRRQGVYDCYTTLIEKGQARLADVRYPELPDNY